VGLPLIAYSLKEKLSSAMDERTAAPSKSLLIYQLNITYKTTLQKSLCDKPLLEKH